MKEQLAKIDNIKWSNKDNAKFYEQFPASKLEETAGGAGIATYCDLELIRSYIMQASSILEVGAGYGRVIDYLQKIGFSGTITAVERSTALYSRLTKKYLENVNIIHADLLTVTMQQRFDLVLWLWAGIADFTLAEQELALKKLALLVADRGYLVLDTFDVNSNVIGALESRGQQRTIYLNGEKICVYIPVAGEIEQNMLRLNFAKIDNISYQTTTNKSRILHIFRK